MNLLLTVVPDTVEGIYEGKGGRKNVLPERMRFLHPDAARAFLAADAEFRRLTGHGLRVSDMLRSAESSLAAKASKRGAARPAYSGHNYGFSIDFDLDWILHVSGWSKAQFDDFMAAHGWFCYWRNSDPHPLEDWHYNFFGDDPAKWLETCSDERTGNGLEAKIQALYGPSFVVIPMQAQFALKSMGMYSGEADGIVGPITRAAIGAFQRAWGLVDDGTLNLKTQRTLAFLVANRTIV